MVSLPFCLLCLLGANGITRALKTQQNRERQCFTLLGSDWFMECAHEWACRFFRGENLVVYHDTAWWPMRFRIPAYVHGVVTHL